MGAYRARSIRWWSPAFRTARSGDEPPYLRRRTDKFEKLPGDGELSTKERGTMGTTPVRYFTSTCPRRTGRRLN